MHQHYANMLTIKHTGVYLVGKLAKLLKDYGIANNVYCPLCRVQESGPKTD